MPIGMDRSIRDMYKFESATPRQLESIQALQPGDYEIYSRKLEMICTEGRETFIRMAVNALAETGDLAAALHTAEGDVGSAAISLAMHLACAQNGIKYIMKYFKDDESVGVKPGDIFYFNDGRFGGVHSPDQIMVSPIFWKEELIGWVSMGSHELEVGANEPGGHSPFAKNIYMDGFQLPPVKIGENYTLKTDLLEMMANFIRLPIAQILDVQAREASCQVLVRRVWEICEEKGPEVFIGTMRKAIEESAEAARQKISKLNDGTFRQTLFAGTAGNGKEGLIKIMVAVHKKDDHAVIDFSGTSPKIKEGNFNTYPHTIIAVTACYFFQYLFSDLKPNIGLFAPFDYIIPDECIFNAERDDATSAGITISADTVQAVHVCFEKMMLDSEWGENLVGTWPQVQSITMAGANQFGRRFVLKEQGLANGNGTGGRRQMDGQDLCGFPYGYTGEFPDTEHQEVAFPVVSLYRSKWSPNAFGMGKYRGGRGIQVAFMVKNAPVPVFMIGIAIAHRFNRSPGMFGGYPSVPLPYFVLKNSNLKELMEQGSEYIPYSNQELVENIKAGKIIGEFAIPPEKTGFMLNNGDLITASSYGGPGYGDVLDRPAELVAKDLKDGSIGEWQAANLFKVACDPITFEVDEDETARLRTAEREDRKRRGKPYTEFEKEWLTKKPKAEILKNYGTWPDARP